MNPDLIRKEDLSEPKRKPNKSDSQELVVSQPVMVRMK